MKAFKRFVYLNNNNPGASVKGTLSHEEKKAMIQVCVEASQNDNNSNNLLPGSEPSSHCYPLAKAEALAYPSNSCLACGSENMSRTEEPVSEPLHASTTSLFRRLSRKSPSRGRDTRRSSLPSQNMHLVRSTSQPRTSKLSTRSDYGDGSSKPDVESRVVESAEKVQRSQSAKSKTLGKSNSLKRKFLSFARRRPSEKKSSPKKRNDEGAGMNKTLSYSSPQLSIFSVNAAGSGTSRASLAQKLVFWRLTIPHHCDCLGNGKLLLSWPEGILHLNVEVSCVGDAGTSRTNVPCQLQFVSWTSITVNTTNTLSNAKLVFQYMADLFASFWIFSIV